jgi:hypothetical protein
MAGDRFWWRSECGRGSFWGAWSEGRRPSRQVVIERLIRAFFKGRITSAEYQQLETLIEKHPFAEREDTPVPDLGEPYMYLLWRAGLLERDRANIWVLVTCGVVSILLGGVFFGWLQSESLIPTFWSDNLNAALFMLSWPSATFLGLRLLHNKLNKGEWLPDEALSYLRGALIWAILPVFLSLISWLCRGSWKLWEVLAGGGLLLMLILILSGLLRIVGREPYRNPRSWLRG